MLDGHVEPWVNRTVRFQQNKFPPEGAAASIPAVETLVAIQKATVMFERSDS